VCYSLWYNAPTMLPAGGRQHRGCIIPQAVTHSLVLLKMGKDFIKEYGTLGTRGVSQTTRNNKRLLILGRAQEHLI